MRHHYNWQSGDLKKQVRLLSKELDGLKDHIARQGVNAYQDARHAGESVAEAASDYFSEAWPEIRRGTRRLSKTVHDNPGTTAAIAAGGLLVMCLAASVFMRKR